MKRLKLWILRRWFHAELHEAWAGGFMDGTRTLANFAQALRR